MPRLDAYSGHPQSENYNQESMQTPMGGVGHQNVPRTYADTRTSLSGSQYGSMPHTDGYAGGPHIENYVNDFAQKPLGGSIHPVVHTIQPGFVQPTMPSASQTGFVHPSMATAPSFVHPNTYAANNGRSEETSSYYQSQEGVNPNMVTYPSSSTPVSTKYGSFSEHTNGPERIASAPLPASNVEPYKPPLDKIAEAQKAAKFAVSALSFDDIPTAISYLQRSIELLTRPSLA